MKKIEKISDLNAGDLVRGKLSGNVWRVMAVYGERATAVQVQDLTNPHEWLLLEEPKEKTISKE